MHTKYGGVVELVAWHVPVLAFPGDAGLQTCHWDPMLTVAGQSGLHVV